MGQRGGGYLFIEPFSPKAHPYSLVCDIIYLHGFFYGLLAWRVIDLLHVHIQLSPAAIGGRGGGKYHTNFLDLIAAHLYLLTQILTAAKTLVTINTFMPIFFL